MNKNLIVSAFIMLFAFEAIAQSDTMYVMKNGLILGKFSVVNQIDSIIFYKPQLNNTVIDIDGNYYNTVTIGSQIWMKENLRVTKYNDGGEIPLVTDNTTWVSLSSAAYCWYNNDQAANGIIYGALYNWYTVNTSSNGGKNVCPEGWHIPSVTEWNTLITELGGESIAGGKLKENGTTHWNSPNTGATNESGFTALPGGYRSNNGIPYDIGNYSTWWTSTEFNEYAASKKILNYSASVMSDSHDKRFGFSIRCLKD